MAAVSLLIDLDSLLRLASVDIVAHFRIVSADGLISAPFIEEFLHVGAIGAIQSILSVLTALLLSRPGKRTFKVELILSAHVPFHLLDYVADLDIGMAVNCRSDRVSADVV